MGIAVGAAPLVNVCTVLSLSTVNLHIQSGVDIFQAISRAVGENRSRYRTQVNMAQERCGIILGDPAGHIGIGDVLDARFCAKTSRIGLAELLGIIAVGGVRFDQRIAVDRTAGIQ